MLNWAGIVLAGLLNGSFAVPLKTTRTWKFDHIWMVHSLLAMGLLPWGFAIVVVPEWSSILGSVPASGWLGLTGWGVLFGVGSLLYGVAVDLLGIAESVCNSSIIRLLPFGSQHISRPHGRTYVKHAKPSASRCTAASVSFRWWFSQVQ